MTKAKDFTESAVKLCNPEPVKVLLEKLSTYQAHLENLNEDLKTVAKNVVEEIAEQAKLIASTQEQIKAAVEEHGSYQDTENERYAVKYERKTAVYGNLPSFKKNFPKFVDLCIKETIDITALKGQVKGKLITEEELEKTKVLTWDTGYAFYVR